MGGVGVVVLIYRDCAVMARNGKMLDIIGLGKCEDNFTLRGPMTFNHSTE